MIFEEWDPPSQPVPEENENAPAPPPQPITTFDGLVIAEVEQGQLEAALKKRMTLLLRAHQTLGDLNSARDAAKVIKTEAVQAYQPAAELPISVDAELLSKFFAQSEERYCALQAATATVIGSTRAADSAANGIAAMSSELMQICDAVEKSQPAMTGTPVIVAARHLAAKSAQSVAVTDETTVDCAREPVAQHQQQLADLQAVSLRLALAVGKAKALAATVRAAHQAVETAATAKDIVQPTRPTEEEVQRYLRQLEERMLDRQKAHRNGTLIFAEQSAALQDLVAGKALLEEQIKAHDRRANTASYQLNAASALGQIVIGACDKVYTELQKASRLEAEAKARFDVFERSSATPKETKQIEGLRIAMRDLGYSFGRLREANAAFEATNDLDAVTVTRKGIGASSSLETSLEWLRQNDRLQEDARKQNLSRTTKLELLRESTAAYREQVESVSTALHRLLVAILPKKDTKPCDELRALLNAASWMCKDVDEDEARFPVY